MLRLLALLLCTFIVSGFVHADSWRAARVQAKASEDGQFVIRIVPGKSMGDVFGYGGEPKGPYATAEWHRFNGKSYEKIHDRTLLNPIAPVDIEVTNRGALIAIDNWHNLGIGNALVIYSADGGVVKKFTLLDLYTQSDLEKLKTTASSIPWRCPGLSTSLEADTELCVDDTLGGRFVFKLDSAAFEYQRGGGSCRDGRP